MKKNTQKTKIAIVSGKGGVGKSMLASSLLMLFAKEKKVTAVDCDVDAPNLHLWLGFRGDWDIRKKIFAATKAEVTNEYCPECEKYKDICQFGALKITNHRVEINPFLCEGCGACKEVFPKGIVKIKKVANGQLRIKKEIFGFPLISAQLYPGESGSGKIVDRIKQEAEKFETDLVVLDAPAGIGCPVIATVKDVDYVLIVTEPTPSAFSDLKRVLMIINFFKLEYGVIINKWDINPYQSQKIASWAQRKLLGKISYDQRVLKAVAQLTPILKTELLIKKEVEKIYQRLKKILCKKLS